MKEVKFYENIADKLLKFAVIFAKTQNKYFANTRTEIHGKCLKVIGKMGKI